MKPIEVTITAPLEPTCRGMLREYDRGTVRYCGLAPNHPGNCEYGPVLSVNNVTVTVTKRRR